MEFDDASYIEYTYDDRYQLDSETRKTSADVQVYKYEWTYDDSGNRLTQNKESSAGVDLHYTEYSYNGANQLKDEDRWEDDTKNNNDIYEIDYAYDGAGNMTDKTFDDEVGAGDVDWDYTYNYENRLTMVEKDTGGGMTEVGEYIYSVVGNRVQSKIDQTTTLKYYHDGVNCVGDYDGTSTRWYVTPFLDENLMINDGNDYFYTQDGLGSVRELIDTSQNTQNSYDYEAFGSFYGTPTENVKNRYTYTGREWDSESSQYYYRARYYQPTTGRFGRRDPIEKLNLYTYTDNKPVIFVDPLGELPVIIIGDGGIVQFLPPGRFEKDPIPNRWTRQVNFGEGWARVLATPWDIHTGVKTCLKDDEAWAWVKEEFEFQVTKGLKQAAFGYTGYSFEVVPVYRFSVLTTFGVHEHKIELWAATSVLMMGGNIINNVRHPVGWWHLRERRYQLTGTFNQVLRFFPNSTVVPPATVFGKCPYGVTIRVRIGFKTDVKRLKGEEQAWEQLIGYGQLYIIVRGIQ